MTPTIAAEFKWPYDLVIDCYNLEVICVSCYPPFNSL